MLVSQKHKKLVLNLRNPGKVCALLPNAKTLEYKGTQLVALPHTTRNTRVLRSIGIKAPNPILHHYDWPCRFPSGPFDHQRVTADFLSINPRAYCLNGMGSGKTAAALWAANWLKRQGEIDWVLVVSPLSTLERAWADEIFSNIPDMTYAVLHGTAIRRKKLIAAPYDCYIINHDGLKTKSVLAALLVKPGRGLVIIDELATYRNSGTDRWKHLNLLVNGNRKLGLQPKEWVWGLTGTPIPNEPTDVWGQCRLVTPDQVPPYFGAFRDKVMRKVSNFVWVPREGALETAHAAMQPAIRFSREQCIDLPPTTYVDREVEMTPEQAKMYASMQARLRAEYENGQITALNQAVKAMKLLQIACGVAYDGETNVIIPAAPRMDGVMEVIEQAGAKVLVFIPFTGALNRIADYIRRHWTVEIVDGGVSKNERDRIFGEFQSPHGARVIVAQPRTMSHGLTLTAADVVCWYAPCASAETYQQANMRIVRPGQKRNTLIVRMQGTQAERKMYARLDGRETTQFSFLDLFD